MRKRRRHARKCAVLHLSGYVDGEGCFCVSVNKNIRSRFGFEIRPSFSVSQNQDRSEVLYLIKDYFDVGTIRPDRSDKTLKYEIRSILDLTNKVIPHFEKYPLISNKSKSYSLFKNVCQMVIDKEHLSEAGFRKICKIADRINSSGKRKFVLGDKDIVSASRNRG